MILNVVSYQIESGEWNVEENLTSFEPIFNVFKNGHYFIIKDNNNNKLKFEIESFEKDYDKLFNELGELDLSKEWKIVIYDSSNNEDFDCKAHIANRKKDCVNLDLIKSVPHYDKESGFLYKNNNRFAIYGELLLDHINIFIKIANKFLKIKND